MMNNIFSLLRKFIASKLGINIFGLLAVCSLIWLIGHIFGFSIRLRLILIILIILTLLLTLFLRFLWVKHRGQELQKQLQAQTESLAGRQLEVELLKEKLAEAISSLKASELGVKFRGNAALYALPWYMIIGPSASGKSTLLRNSGLSFPFLNNNDIQVKGFGGTRNCDWWFADQAIILDTAGRYTTEENDRDEWLAFLELLRKNRPRLPINGIIVAIDLAELLAADEKNINWHVKVIRERIEELYSRLGFIFPVTLLFTKCDLLKGFIEFFADLNQAQREQVWGINFAQDYSEQLNELYGKLNQLCLHKIAVERNLARKFAIYDFPEQFQMALHKVKQFFELLLKENPYQEMPIFSGAYFTSGTQELNPIARLVGEEEGASLEKKSYFIKDLFSKVIFPNKDAAAKTRKRVQAQLWFKSAGVVGCVGVLGMAFMLYSASFTSNAILLHKGEEITAKVLQDNSLDSLLDAYNYYAALLNYKTEIPWHLRLGLYRGNSQIEPIQKILAAILRDKFLQPMGIYLTKELNKNNELWQTTSPEQQTQLRGTYYTTLKAYLMLSFPKRIDLEQATIIFSNYWSKILSGNTIEATRLSGIVKFYLQHPGFWRANEALVQKARSQLYLADDAENLYAQIKPIYGANLPPIILHELLKHQELTSDYQVPGIYTISAWHKIVKPAILKIAKTANQGDWVINTPFALLNETHLNSNALGSTQKIQQEITSLYFADYKQAWLKLLTATKVRQFGSLTDANSEIAILANTDGPITQLLQIVTTNTNIKQLDPGFADLRHITGDAFKSYLNEIIKMQNDLQALTASPNQSRDAEHFAAQLLSGSGGDTELYRSMIAANMLVNQVDDVQTRIALKQFLLQPIRETWRAILHVATHGIDQLWQTQIISDYQQNITHKFPFDHYANEDVAVADIRDFFQLKNGLLWSFVNTYLQPFLVHTERGWQEQKWLDIGAGFSSQMLHALNQARVISQDLFEGGGDQLNFNYQIFPQPTHGLSQIIWLLNGQTYHYKNGPQEWHQFNWPGKDDEQDSYLSVIAVDGSNPRIIQAQGVWGLFHLLNNGHLKIEHNSTKVTWLLKNNKHSYHVNLLLHPNGRGNIFQEILVNSFILPEHLFIVHNNGI